MDIQTLMAGAGAGGGDDEGPDEGAPDAESDPIVAALDALKDQIDAIEAQIMQGKTKPGAEPPPEAGPPAPGAGV
jgi:hypothetical protein